MVFGFFKKSETERLLASQGVESMQNQIKNHAVILSVISTQPKIFTFKILLNSVKVGMAKCWHPEGGTFSPSSPTATASFSLQ